VWASQRLADGWKYGPRRNDERKEHPGLVAYEELSEVEKDYDRVVAQQVLKAIVALGFHIQKSPGPDSEPPNDRQSPAG
jgi:hypothetical protein